MGNGAKHRSRSHILGLEGEEKGRGRERGREKERVGEDGEGKGGEIATEDTSMSEKEFINL